MELKIIIVKRSFESEPLEQLNINYKRRKLDGPITLSMVATVKSKDESLAPIIKDIVSKCKEEKLFRLQEKKGLSHPDLFKYRTCKGASAKVEDSNAAAAARRYQIVNKHRGLTELDDDSEKFLASTDCFKIDIPHNAELQGADAQSAASSALTPGAAKDRALDIEVVDVDEVHNEEKDVICMNGVPLQTTYLYDIFLTQVPHGCSVDDFDLTRAAELDSEDAEYVDSDDSEDSNAENYYTNDYPDEESDSSLEGRVNDDYWDVELSSRMKRSLGFGGDSHGRTRTPFKIIGSVVPEHLESMLDWGALQSDDDGDVSSIDCEQVDHDSDDESQE